MAVYECKGKEACRKLAEKELKIACFAVALSAEIVVVSYLLFPPISNYTGHFKKLVMSVDYFHVWSNDE